MKKRIVVFLIVLVCCYVYVRAQEVGLSPSFDYSQIKEHPRLLLSKGEEALIKSAISKNPEFEKIDAHIHQISDQILKEDPLTFKKIGRRLLSVSREALGRLFYLSYSYRMTGDAKYLDRAEKELESVCNFESWNPSHFLDVGEMCMAVAIAYDWLYDDLKESTRQIVRNAVLEKAFAPSYEERYNRFLRMHSNWNSVCNGGLVFGALAIFEDEKESSIAIIERALKSNQLALKSYAPDGNYPEGPSYWNYGTSFQVMFSAALESALGSDGGLSIAPGFMETGYYMLFTVGSSGQFFNYYDGGGRVSSRPVLFWFADKLDDLSLLSEEKTFIHNGKYTSGTNVRNIGRILPSVLVFGKNMDLSKVERSTKKVFIGHGRVPVTMVRTDLEPGKGRYLGIKGGKASDAHGHMDQGTFVYDVGPLRWAMDFGAENYNAVESQGVKLWDRAQNAQRWDVFRYNNLNHNTLTINHQRHNVKGKAEIVETYENGKELGGKVDLTPVLNLDNELKSATRKAVIVDDSYLRIEDVVEVNDKPVDLRWNMVTRTKAEIIDNSTIRLSQKGKTMLLKFEANIPFKLAIRPSENPKEYKCEFGDYNYGDYNQRNKGTVMVGFDAKIPANSTVKFTASFVE